MTQPRALRPGLRARLLGLVLLALLPSLAIILYSAAEQRRAGRDAARTQTLRLARDAAADAERLVEATRGLLLGLAQAPEIGGADSARCPALLAGVVGRQPVYANIGVAASDGRIVCSAAPFGGKISIGDRSYFRAALRTRRFSGGEYVVGRITGRASLNFGAPVLDGRRVRAVVFAALDLGWLERDLARANLPSGSTLFVVDENATLLTGGNDWTPLAGRSVRSAEVVRAALARPEGTARAPGLDGVDRLWGFAELEPAVRDGKLRVAIGMPVAAVEAPANRARARNLALLGLASALALTAAWGVGGLFVVRPVRALLRAIERLGTGDLTARTGLLAEGRGELADLARGFDRMAGSLQHVARRHRLVLEAAGEGIAGCDPDGRVTFANPAAGKMLGWDPDELVGQDAHDVLHPTSPNGSAGSQSACGACAAARQGTVYHGTSDVFWRRDGTSFPGECLATPIREQDGVAGTVVVFRDITALKAYTEALEYQARHDVLTGLPNRAALQETLQAALEEQPEQPAAVLLIDLDQFKEINYALGHRTGDRLLERVGARLRRGVAAAAAVTRLGGDEFALVIPGAGPEDARRVARAILADLRKPFSLDHLALDVRATIGIALSPVHGADADTLLRRADIAMYAAKHAEEGYAIYSAAHDPYSPERLRLLGELRHAIEENCLFLLYQPKVDLQTGRVMSLEALVRWRHPRLGIIAPDQFITLAEQTGSIRPITLWVLESAIRQAHAWRRAGWSPSVAVNVSARDLQDTELPDRVEELLARWDVDPSGLHLEITEGVVMADPARSLQILTRLSAMGVRISIDDFGTGYSSLGYLKRLPVDEIKIDKSFVIDLAGDRSDEQIVRSTIGLGHDLGLTVVAEGVEDRETWDRLAAMGCDAAQGYFASPPLAASDVARRYGVG